MPIDPKLPDKKRAWVPLEAAKEARNGTRVIRLGNARGAFSRDTLWQWQRWMGKEKGNARARGVAFVLAAVAHGFVALVMSQLKTPVRINEGSPGFAPVPITIREGRGLPTEPVQKGEEVAKANSPLEPALPRAAPRGAPNVRTPAQKKTTPRDRPLGNPPLTRAPEDHTTGSFAVPVPNPEPAPDPREPSNAPVSPDAGVFTPPDTTQVAPSTTSKGLRRFLPGGSKDYLDRQRTIGDIVGQGPIGGDIPAPEKTVNPDDRPIITEQSYTLSHYFDKLNRRFSDAWGPSRTLPPNSTFVGVTGESIDYDIVVNRDGTLRKITNVTAKRQPWRRFEDVDKIVFDVFSNVFPLDAVPTRIPQDPVVIRKRIQYTGYRYSIF